MAFGSDKSERGALDVIVVGGGQAGLAVGYYLRRSCGEQAHSAHYRSPEPFSGKRVVVVGGGNSGAQILAEVSKVAEATWVTSEEPRFLPDDVDGRVLFERATERYQAKREGRDTEPVGGLGTW